MPGVVSGHGSMTSRSVVDGPATVCSPVRVLRAGSAGPTIQPSRICTRRKQPHDNSVSFRAATAAWDSAPQSSPATSYGFSPTPCMSTYQYANVHMMASSESARSRPDAGQIDNAFGTAGTGGPVSLPQPRLGRVLGHTSTVVARLLRVDHRRTWLGRYGHASGPHDFRSRA
jgi:hypothetical protein